MAQAAAREAITQPGPAVDADMPTLHVRCGSDIKGELEAARFRGDFLTVWDPFPVGPVTDAPDWIAQRARFHADTGTVRDVDYDEFLAELTDSDRRLAASAKSYARVVIWTEHDSHDQLSLIRCLAHYARTRPPRVLELDPSKPLSRLTAFHRPRPAPARSDVAALEFGAKSSMLNGCQSAPQRGLR